MANLTLTRQWVENIYQLETSDPVMGGPDGIDNRQAKELGARTNWLKDQVDGINQDRTGYAPKASPAFTGIPTAPTAAAGTNNAQIATTEFVKTAIAALVGSAPAALDTLEELARALAGDANLKATLLAEIGKKANATDFNALHDLFIGIPIPYPLSTVPTGCLAMNGQRFDTRRYPKLAQKYPSGQLPDLRGEFIRGWDNGRGVDAGRGLLSAQGDAIRNITGQVGTDNGWIFRSPSGAIFDPYNGNNTQRLRAVTTPDGVGNDGRSIGWFNFDASKVVPTANENRPRNIAYHYICLAA
ncbi:phage tail protein [Haemophilus parainfluenzae]|uniref:Tail fiber protein n=1 Tax=Haemophilus parainfluenzae TaxID=729 RepID=A0A377JIP8_HAEPA|nr:phage tail protein [Haemophilus parainfluenzae]MBS6284346.1 tail fiber protein [Haemophilus parainfluenzae]STP05654.1 tail fiber protein [Haemophilus parainfluenzae]